MKRMRVFKKMAVLIVLSVVLSAPSNVIYAFAEEYIDESESVDYEQSNLIENEESVENIDYLSDNVYRFNRNTEEICIA